MEIIAIGDVHGRDAWKQVDTTTADQIVFLGDYVDNRHYFTNEHIYNNLVAIIQLKRKKPNKVVLLIGNHDAQYLHFPNYGCSGMRPDGQPALTALFNQHKNLFQIAYQYGNHLFTHAGVSNGWYQHRKKYLDQLEGDNTLADRLNAMHERESLAHFLFDVGALRGGDERFGGPAWADRSETIDDYLPGYYQVVGHTPIADITTVGDEQGSITYCDVTQTRAEFYELTL